MGPAHSLQKASYTPQLFFKVVLKYIALIYAKKVGFVAIGGNSRPHTEKTKKNPKNLILGPPYSLQRAPYTPQFLFKVILKYIALIYSKNAGFLAIRGNSRPHTKKTKKKSKK